MKLSDFDYNLQKELIAQYPLTNRDSSRLLLFYRDSGRIEHRRFKDLPQFLKKGDILVLNDTKVFKARLIAKREGLEGKVELLLTDKIGNGIYSALTKPSRKLREGTKVLFGNGRLTAEVIGSRNGFKLMRFNAGEDLYKLLDEIGKVPLPPYIKREPEKEDENRYQTIYAKNTGAIAAPTAGLHFTERLLDRLRGNGIDIAYLTLHLGYATFKPVRDEDITRHKLHKEYYQISKDTAEKVNSAKRDGRRVIAVGTTVCRALESSAVKQDTCLSGRQARYEIRDIKAATDLFIYPGYRFKITDALLTNFHLPRTSLLMLVSAFAGVDSVMSAYDEAIDRRYRFYSYGDAMLII